VSQKTRFYHYNLHKDPNIGRRETGATPWVEGDLQEEEHDAIALWRNSQVHNWIDRLLTRKHKGGDPGKVREANCRRGGNLIRGMLPREIERAVSEAHLRPLRRRRG